MVAINQFSFAFGPALLGQLESTAGSYLIGLLVCLLMEMLAASQAAGFESRLLKPGLPLSPDSPYWR